MDSKKLSLEAVSGERHSLRLLRLLGEGGFGKVHLVELEGGAPAVLKLAKPQMHHTFGNEAAMMSLVGGAGGAPELLLQGETFLCMTYGGSCTLQDLWENGALDEELLFRLFLSIGRSLAAIHAKGVVHNDIKADNILVPEPEELVRAGDAQPQVSIIDFGHATPSGAQPSSSAGLADHRDFPQVAPEVFHGKISLPAGDVYALGHLMSDILHDLHMHREIESVRPAVGQLLRQMVQEDYRARPDMAEVITCLTGILQEVREQPAGGGKLRGGRRESLRGRLWWWAGVALHLLLLLVAAGFLLWVVSGRYEAAAQGCRLHNKEARRMHLDRYWLRLKASAALRFLGVSTNLGVPSLPAGLRDCRPLPLLLEALTTALKQEAA